MHEFSAQLHLQATLNNSTGINVPFRFFSLSFFPPKLFQKLRLVVWLLKFWMMTTVRWVTRRFTWRPVTCRAFGGSATRLSALCYWINSHTRCSLNYGGTLKLVGFRSLPYCQNWDIPRLLHCSLTPTRLRDADPGVGGSGAWEAAAWNTKPHISRMHRLTHTYIYIYGHLSCLLTLLKIRQHTA